MIMITKTQARAMYEYYDRLIGKLMDAKIALLEGGVKSYTVYGKIEMQKKGSKSA